MKWRSHVLIGIVALVVTGCMAPKSFVRIMEPTWSSVELRPGMTYDDAWKEVLDVLAKKFEIEMISKDGGYLRTSWIYTWWKAGQMTQNYRVRAIVKFAADELAFIEMDRCRGCGKCLQACSFSAIRLNNQRSTIRSEKT